MAEFRSHKKQENFFLRSIKRQKLFEAFWKLRRINTLQRKAFISFRSITRSIITLSK